MHRQRIRRGVFRSITDLKTDIDACLAEQSSITKPFVWTQFADAVLAKLNRTGCTIRLSQLTASYARDLWRQIGTLRRVPELQQLRLLHRGHKLLAGRKVVPSLAAPAGIAALTMVSGASIWMGRQYRHHD
jgi:hypothetical protein